MQNSCNNYCFIETEEQFNQYKEQLEMAQKLVVDIETTSVSPHTGSILGIAVSTRPHQGLYISIDIVNNHMLQMLGEIGCQSINGLYYSTTPFKDDPYRKPNTGMFKRASAEIGVDWTNGVYVGDKITDLKAAYKAKAKPILVRTGYGVETEKKLNTFANKDLKKRTEIYDNLSQFAHSLVDLS